MASLPIAYLLFSNLLLHSDIATLSHEKETLEAHVTQTKTQIEWLEKENKRLQSENASLMSTAAHRFLASHHLPSGSKPRSKESPASTPTPGEEEEQQEHDPGQDTYLATPTPTMQDARPVEEETDHRPNDVQEQDERRSRVEIEPTMNPRRIADPTPTSHPIVRFSPCTKPSRSKPKETRVPFSILSDGLDDADAKDGAGGHVAQTASIEDMVRERVLRTVNEAFDVCRRAGRFHMNHVADGVMAETAGNEEVDGSQGGRREGKENVRLGD